MVEIAIAVVFNLRVYLQRDSITLLGAKSLIPDSDNKPQTEIKRYKQLIRQYGVFMMMANLNEPVLRTSHTELTLVIRL